MKVCRFESQCGNEKTLPDRSDSSRPFWSIVVIARNEEKTIEASLQSVMDTFSGQSFEVIFVDSDSSDKTLDIALGFPDVQVYRVSDTELLGPSIGRHIGFSFAKGEWILFLDGDSVLNPAWLDDALRLIESDEQIGGVAGEWVQILPAKDGGGEYLHQFPQSDYDHASHLGSSAAYKREALVRTGGGFNPYMKACEEEELGARLRKAGYRLVRLRTVMTKHSRKNKDETIKELFRRMNRGFYIGMGQIVRHGFSRQLPITDRFASVLRHLQFFPILSLGLVALIVAVWTDNWLFALAWVAGIFILFVLFMMRSKSIRKPSYYFLEWILTSYQVVWGLLKKPRTVDMFPGFTLETSPAHRK